MISPAQLSTLATTVDRLIKSEKRALAGIADLGERMGKLEARVTRLEAREDIVISEAKGAASHAATQVAIASVADMARRVGALEERTSRGRLSRGQS